MFLVLDRGVLAFSGTLHGSLGVVSVGGFWANWQLKSIKGEAPRFIDDDRLFQEGTLCSSLLEPVLKQLEAAAAATWIVLSCTLEDD